MPLKGFNLPLNAPSTVGVLANLQDVEDLLQLILDEVELIQDNTDEIETKIDSTITAIQEVRDKLNVTRVEETASAVAADIDFTTAVETVAHDITLIALTRTTSEKIDFEVFLKRGVVEHLLVGKKQCDGLDFAVLELFKLDAGTQLRIKTTGAAAGTLDLTVIKEEKNG